MNIIGRAEQYRTIARAHICKSQLRQLTGPPNRDLHSLALGSGL